MKTVRLEGLVRIRDLELPLLRRAAVSVPGAVTDAWPVEVENLYARPSPGSAGASSRTPPS
ncbi:hypothetical protein ACFQ60_23520 [Streptomyces zhihengii]